MKGDEVVVTDAIHYRCIYRRRLSLLFSRNEPDLRDDCRWYNLEGSEPILHV